MNRWLKPSVTLLEEIVDMILLQQYLNDLEENTQRWVRLHHAKMSTEALKLAEYFVHKGKGPVKKNKPGTSASVKYVECIWKIRPQIDL